MYDILELNKKLVSELRQIAKELNVKRADSLKKQDLIYKILDQQAINATSEVKPEKKSLGRKRISDKPKSTSRDDQKKDTRPSKERVKPENKQKEQKTSPDVKEKEVKTEPKRVEPSDKKE